MGTLRCCIKHAVWMKRSLRWCPPWETQIFFWLVLCAPRSGTSSHAMMTRSVRRTTIAPSLFVDMSIDLLTISMLNRRHLCIDFNLHPVKSVTFSLDNHIRTFYFLFAVHSSSHRNRSSPKREQHLKAWLIATFDFSRRNTSSNS